MTDAAPFKARRSTLSPLEDTGVGRLIGHTKGRMNTNLRAIIDQNGRPLIFLRAGQQISNYTGAADL
ncbi:hypothetical protein [Acetobacter sp. DsW_063]|uniref:hypothetical protein n=1 Tax=Acetobacter sp. DsW_063 TaxID=1514894 RepID=UPI001302AD9A|nr:hypothetical protein [Acetobacter sp. DsW_063]